MKKQKQLRIRVAQPYLGTGVKNSLVLRQGYDGPEIEIEAGLGYDHVVLLSRPHIKKKLISWLQKALSEQPKSKSIGRL